MPVILYSNLFLLQSIKNWKVKFGKIQRSIFGSFLSLGFVSSVADLIFLLWIWIKLSWSNNFCFEFWSTRFDPNPGQRILDQLDLIKIPKKLDQHDLIQIQEETYWIKSNFGTDQKLIAGMTIEKFQTKTTIACVSCATIGENSATARNSCQPIGARPAQFSKMLVNHLTSKYCARICKIQNIMTYLFRRYVNCFLSSYGASAG